jgi:glutaconate CoA-transferase, subunit B
VLVTVADHPEESLGYSMPELLAVVLARELEDELVGILGTRSEIAYVACRLAQRLSAPGLWFMSGPSGVVNPGIDRVAPIADYALFPLAEAHTDLTDNIDFIDWSQHFFDFAVLGGLQVDRFGNLNTVVVGEWSHPKLRGPGAIGASVLAAHAGHFFILMPDHTPRSFRPAVDFISAVGFGRTGVEREVLGLPGKGPRLLISPLGTFDFDGPSHEMRIRSLHPGVTVDDVQDRTGFTVIVPSGFTETPIPSAEELDILRSEIDRTHVLSEQGN